MKLFAQVADDAGRCHRGPHGFLRHETKIADAVRGDGRTGCRIPEHPVQLVRLPVAALLPGEYYITSPTGT